MLAGLAASLGEMFNWPLEVTFSSNISMMWVEQLSQFMCKTALSVSNLQHTNCNSYNIKNSVSVLLSSNDPKFQDQSTLVANTFLSS